MSRPLAVDTLTPTSVLVSTAVKTTTYSAAAGQLVRVDPTGGAFSVNLPSAATLKDAQIGITNQTASANVVTISPNGGDTIAGDASISISAARVTVILQSDGGTNWILL